MRCTKCGYRTEVLETINKGDYTRRRRRCLNHECQHRFTTTEVAAERAEQLAEHEVMERLQRKHDPGIDHEALAAAIRVDHRRAEIKRLQRLENKRLVEAGVLSPDDARKLLRGY